MQTQFNPDSNCLSIITVAQAACAARLPSCAYIEPQASAVVLLARSIAVNIRCWKPDSSQTQKSTCPPPAATIKTGCTSAGRTGWNAEAERHPVYPNSDQRTWYELKVGMRHLPLECGRKHRMHDPIVQSVRCMTIQLVAGLTVPRE